MRFTVREVQARLGAVVSLALLVGACVPGPSAGPADSPRLATPSPATAGRLGTFDLTSSQGLSIGTIALTQATPDSVSIELTLADSGIHPWGIYDQHDCAMPPANHDSPFQFADVEDGHHTEEIEAASYLAYPSDLVAIVFGPGGGGVLGCAGLGPPALAPRPSASAAACGAATSVPPATGHKDVALSKDLLSNADIYVMRDDGSDVRRLTDALGPDFKPSWSPDGGQIAFRTSRDGQDEIYTMRADGTCQRNLTNDPADDRSPAWSPDGRSIAFDHFFVGRFQDVAVIDLASRHVRRVTTHSGEYPAWSPDGTKLAFASARDGDYELFVIDADGTHERQLTTNARYDMYPAWSPDGRWLAYESGSDSFRDIDIHVMRVDGSDDRQLTRGEATNRFPAWSADGRLAWSREGTIVIADPFDPAPIEIGPGQFPAWQP
jgi:WD40 repeat protein